MLHYILSEKSCEDDAIEPRSDPRRIKIRKLSWERSKLSNIKAKLDEVNLAGLTEKQRRTSACVSRTEEESSHHPAKGPCWRVPNRFFGIRDLGYFKDGIRDFEGKGGRDSGL